MPLSRRAIGAPPGQDLDRRGGAKRRGGGSSSPFLDPPPRLRGSRKLRGFFLYRAATPPVQEGRSAHRLMRQVNASSEPVSRFQISPNTLSKIRSTFFRRRVESKT